MPDDYTKSKTKRPRGLVHITDDRCKGCEFCVAFCPTKVLAMSDVFNKKGYHPPRAVNPDACSNCNLCALYCPEFAIWATKIEDEKK
jgi:2-oxoglutarate ferredoxin oxidoreductase subunit delta